MDRNVDGSEDGAETSAKVKAIMALKGRLWPLVEPQAFTIEADLYGDVVDFLREHLDLPNSGQYHVLASSILLSYRLTLLSGDAAQPAIFNSVPYLLFMGPPNSGKTRGLEVAEALCDRPLRTGSATPGGLYQAIQTLNPTLLLDEADLYSGAGERWEEIRALLREAYRRGGRVLRGSAETGVPELYDVFCQVILASRNPLEAALMQRCIVIPMERATRKVRAQIDRERAGRLRAQLVYYRFHHSQPSADLEILRNEVGDGRVAELYGPLMAIAPTEEAKAELMQLAKMEWKDRLSEEVTGEESELVQALDKLSLEWEREGFLAIKDVVDLLNQERPSRYQLSPDRVGRRLKGLGFKGARSGGGKKRGILWDPQLLERLKRRFLPSEGEAPAEGGTPLRSVTSGLVSHPPEGDTSRVDHYDTSDTSTGVPPHGRLAPEENPWLEDLISRLRMAFLGGTEKDFKEMAEKIGSLTHEETDTLFKQLVDAGQLARDPQGYWTWTNL